MKYGMWKTKWWTWSGGKYQRMEDNLCEYLWVLFKKKKHLKLWNQK